MLSVGLDQVKSVWIGKLSGHIGVNSDLLS